MDETNGKEEAGQGTDNYFSDLKKSFKASTRTAKFFIELAALAVVVIYTWETYRTNNLTQCALHQSESQFSKSQATSKQQFQDDQRPYIWFQGSDPPRKRTDGKLEAKIFVANYGKTPAMKVRGIARIFLGEHARDKADEWLKQMDKGTLEDRDISVALLPPKVPEDYRKEGFGIPAITEDIPKTTDLQYAVTHNFGKVIVGRMEYYGLDKKTFYCPISAGKAFLPVPLEVIATMAKAICNRHTPPALSWQANIACASSILLPGNLFAFRNLTSKFFSHDLSCPQPSKPAS